MVAVVIVLGVLARINYKPPGRSLKNFSSRFATFFDKIYCFEAQYQPWPVMLGRIQNMDPWYIDHLCGPRPWTSSWTWSMDYPLGPPLIYEEEFLLEV